MGSFAFLGTAPSVHRAVDAAAVSTGTSVSRFIARERSTVSNFDRSVKGCTGPTGASGAFLGMAD